MSKEIYISSTPHETRLAIVEEDNLAEIYYERENEYTLAGSIYNGKVTRVLPGMQSAFVDIGLERDAFLYITDFLEEAPDSEEFDTAPAADRPRTSGGGGGGEQRERGGRGRRGGRDRDRNRGQERQDGQQQPAAEGSDFGDSSHDSGDIEALPTGEAAPGTSAEGEGTAEGGRRWRGRRGRRRGRGGNRTGEQNAPQGEDQTVSSEEQDTFAEPGAFEAAADDHATPAAEEPRHDAYEGGRNRFRREGRGESREASPEQGEHGGRRRQRGSEARRERYGAGDAASRTGPIDDAYGGPASGGEPILLPGESLAKYRPQEAAPATEESTASSAAATPANMLPPATLYTLAEGWDGGSVLPGETLSRRRSAPPVEPTRDRGGRRRNRDGRREEGHAPATEELQSAAPAAQMPVPEAEPAPVTEPPAAEAQAVVETEYEPTEASASYRVDPVPPSEFRQNAPAVEPEAEEAALEEHDVTSISAAGEMHSEPVATPVEIDEAQSEETADPIHLEGAVVATENEFDVEEAPEVETSSVPQTLQASSIEEMDDLEEETLEGAADLGTMLREMSIDQITRSQPELDEDEDDFEEDFLEEDTLEDEFEEDSESTEEAIDEPILSDAFERTEVLEEGGSNEFGEDFAGSNEGAPQNQEGRNRDSGRHNEPRRGRESERRSRRGDRDRGRGRSGHGDHRSRSSAQLTNLPAISDLLKPGQEVLVQIAKEPIAKKGARITSHIALPGRFLVFMPTVNHTGVSRKIESDGERRRLKEILLSEKGDASGGFIVRTAAAGATEEELRSDLRFLLNLWSDIKSRSDSSKSPALIYHDLNLVERILRDQVTDNFSAIWVDTEAEYERVLRFLQRFQPSLIRRVKLYLKETPLFEQFGITEEINKALRSKVWLKSGGSIVINQTEALVAIDINTGKYVGKTARLEDTIVKTNLDAIPEIVRQIRLRDLGGIIIIDFIDMDDRKNRNRVMAALEEELKTDRAPSKVLQFNDFGLVAITRKRVRQSLERTLSTPCNICAGTGMVKSPITVCNDIYVELRKMHKHLDRGDVMLRVHPDVVKQLKNAGSKWLQEMEEMAGKTILVKSDPGLHPEQFDIH